MSICLLNGQRPKKNDRRDYSGDQLLLGRILPWHWPCADAGDGADGADGQLKTGPHG